MNLRPEELRLGGPPVDNVAIDEEGTITLVRSGGIQHRLGLTLSLICFRSVTVTVMVFFVGGASAVLSVSLVYWGGSSVDAIMMSMPSLVYVLGLSGSAHIINYYHAAVAEHGYAGCTGTRHPPWMEAGGVVQCDDRHRVGVVGHERSDTHPQLRHLLGVGRHGDPADPLHLPPRVLAVVSARPPSRHHETARRKVRGWSVSWGASGSVSGASASGATCWFRFGCIAVIVGVGWGVSRIQTSVNMLKMFHS